MTVAEVTGLWQITRQPRFSVSMGDNSIVQIPFNAFKLINLGQSVGLEVYQSLYNDHTEPVGIIAVTQALGLIKPSDNAVDTFNQRWARGSARWKIQETGIEVVTGKSSTTGEMVRTREGEITTMVLSLLLDSMEADRVAEIVRAMIEAMPSNLVPIRPRRAQVGNVVKSVEAQTSCVSWKEEIREAERTVFEGPQVFLTNGVLPSASFDIPARCMAAYYQVLCTVTRFPEQYHGVLETGGSLTLPFTLAHDICGLRVCVLADGEVLHGNSSFGKWQVRLERKSGMKMTRVRVGKRVDDIQDVLELDEVGLIRANKVPIKGIGRASTIHQALGEVEARELAQLSIAIARMTMSLMKREVLDYSENDDSSLSSQSETSGPTEATRSDTVPLKARLSSQVVALWWDCNVQFAENMFSEGEKIAILQPQGASWSQVKFPNVTNAKIAQFENMSPEEQVQRRMQTKSPCSRADYGKLLRTLTAQLLLLCFLSFNMTSQDNIRVRCKSQPQNTVLGKAINCLKDPKPLGQSDILSSWYHWIKGASPKELDRIDVLTAEGFLIYRSLLVDVSLSPEACEMVIVEPGHLSFESYRTDTVRGYDQGFSVIGHPRYHRMQTGPLKLRSEDKTGAIETNWTVEVDDDVLEVCLQLKYNRAAVSIDTSIFIIAKQSWPLMYGDHTLGCLHGEEYSGTLVDGETIEELTPGFGPGLADMPTSYKPVKLYRSHDNPLGQVACLMSAQGRSLVKVDACLRCCLAAAQKQGLDCVID